MAELSNRMQFEVEGREPTEEEARDWFNMRKFIRWPPWVPKAMEGDFCYWYTYDQLMELKEKEPAYYWHTLKKGLKGQLDILATDEERELLQPDINQVILGHQIATGFTRQW